MHSAKKEKREASLQKWRDGVVGSAVDYRSEGTGFDTLLPLSFYYQRHLMRFVTLLYNIYQHLVLQAVSHKLCCPTGVI